MSRFASQFAFGTGSSESRMAVITFAGSQNIVYEWMYTQQDSKIENLFLGLNYDWDLTFSCVRRYDYTGSCIRRYAHKPVVLTLPI